MQVRALLDEKVYGGGGEKARASSNRGPLNLIRQGRFLESVSAALEAGGEAAQRVLGTYSTSNTTPDKV